MGVLKAPESYSRHSSRSRPIVVSSSRPRRRETLAQIALVPETELQQQVFGALVRAVDDRLDTV